jgi:hypothetical protein
MSRSKSPTNTAINMGSHYLVEVISRNGLCRYFIVDTDAYLAYVKPYRWHISLEGYVCRIVNEEDKTSRKIYLHRVIMNPPEGYQVDHVSHDTLDLRRSNLRICTHAENIRNRGAFKNNKSGFKGVHYVKHAKKWLATIQCDGKKEHLGYFDSRLEAYVAYMNRGKELHGEFFRAN